MKQYKVEELHPELQRNLRNLTGDAYEMEYAMAQNVQELYETIRGQGHSGLSVGYALNLFSDLVQGKCLSPLTGDEDEWSEPYDGDMMQQNKRMSTVFRTNRDNATAYDIGARAFTDNDGKSWFQTGRTIDGISGFKPITFPYTPSATEYYYVEEVDGKETINPNRRGA